MKMYQNLLTKLNNAAKARKESMAIENGFSTAIEFKSYLETQIKNLTVNSESKELKTAKKEELTDLVIAFDSTGSMSSYIDAVKNHVTTLIPKAFKDNKNLKISVVVFGDYCDMVNATEFGKAYQVIGLTNNTTALIDFVKNAKNTSGGDGDEFYELVINKITEETQWREGSSKSVLLIGDADPHVLGYSCYPYVQNAQIEWRKECLKASELGIVIDTLSIKGNSFYKEVARITNGVCLPFSKSEKTNNLVEATILARGGSSTSEAFHAMSVSSSVTTDADMSAVYTMYKTVVKK